MFGDDDSPHKARLIINKNQDLIMGIFSPSEKRKFIDPVRARYVNEIEQYTNEDVRRFVYATTALSSQLIESFLSPQSPLFLKKHRERLSVSFVEKIFKVWALEDLAGTIAFEEMNQKEKLLPPFTDNLKKFESATLSFFNYSQLDREAFGTLRKLSKGDSDTYNAFVWTLFREALGDGSLFTPEETQHAVLYCLKRSQILQKLLRK